MPAKSSRPKYIIRSKVWLHPGAAGWHFVTLPKETSEEIAILATPLKSAWGSIRVAATIGETSWQTSIFPDNKRRAYVLPVKAAIRKKQKIETGKTVTVTLELLDEYCAKKTRIRRKPACGGRAATG